MPSWQQPTPEQVSAAIALLGRPEQRRHFFDKLENPRWLTPLAERGFFDTPPPPLRDDAKGTIQFPPWPATRYLARMARLPEAQADVLRIALNIPATKNVIVHQDLAEVATHLPAPMAAQLVPKAPAWLAASYHGVILAENLATLIDHLARDGESQAARQLATATLSISKDQSDVRAHFDPWHYARVITRITPSLTATLGDGSLAIVSDLLKTAAPAYVKNGKPTPEDGSTIWHPKVEADEDLHGIKNILLSSTRNIATLLAAKSPEDTNRIVAFLDAQPTKAFHRISLDLLRRQKEAVPAAVAMHLTNRALFDDASLQHEYDRLLHDAFPTLALPDQARILSWINDGPPISHYERREEFFGQRPTPERQARYAKFWQRRHLTPISDSLPPEWAQRYQQIIREIGPEEPEPDEGLTGPNSPITKEELAALTPAGLVEYLATWEPTTNDEFGPSRAGIGVDLTAIIAADPTRLDTLTEQLKTLHPTYVRSYFYGLREAIEKEGSISLIPVLDLSAWVVAQPNVQPPNEPDPFQEEQGWGSTRSAIADLLDLALAKTPNIPFAHREQVWRIIASLAEDPDPIPEFEAKCAPDGDAASLAINTTRGKAIEAVIKYALWVRQQTPEADNFTNMPEVREVLENHLQHDPSMAIRSVYGRFFPWLVLLDHDWAAAHVTTIFDNSQGRVAWETYLMFCAPFDSAIVLLAGYYERAVEALSPNPVPDLRRGKPDPTERLGEHLMARYWRGHLPLNDGLVARFFERASAQVRAHALAYIGRILYAHKGPVPIEIRDRLFALWVARRQAASQALDEHRSELAAFGWWFASGQLDPEWALSELLDVLGLVHTVELHHAVLERLGTLAGAYPQLAVACLRAFSEGERDYWAILGSESHVRTILRAALQSVDARKDAEGLIHTLGTLGYAKFRDLLQPMFRNPTRVLRRRSSLAARRLTS